jgi:NAD-dependent deacetylase
MSGQDTATLIEHVAALIRSARYLTAFTGAGISVESGIPAFRGPGGLLSRCDPRMLELDYFLAHPDKAWPVIKEIFYDNFGRARPNRAHEVLAAWETRGAGSDGLGGLLKCIITQNIDNLHYAAGSRNIVEFHGNSRMLCCIQCAARMEASPSILAILPPHCPCGGIYKPDFIFFGEGIPAEAHERALKAAAETDVMVLVGSTGEVYPAAMVPRMAFDAGARIVEINPDASEFTQSITDIHIALPAAEAFTRLEKEMHA